MGSNCERKKIAIIGVAGRFPGADNTDQFWDNLVNGKNSISFYRDDELKSRGVSEELLSDSNYLRAGYKINNIEQFDAVFFGVNSKEAEVMDPQHRILLETVWDALENASCTADDYDGNIGVFCGASRNTYSKRIPSSFEDITASIEAFQTMIGNSSDFLATRISYKLNLKGPSLTIQTGCSTSLVAVHIACQNLLTNQCEIAIAGGVSLEFPYDVGYTYREGMIWSSDATCRAFDADANGTVFGCGAGIVILKELSNAIKDKDNIYAVICGSSINNDGSEKIGFTAPSIEGQADVISRALNVSGVSPEEISYIETHGTGTILGDPIEVAALSQAFRNNSCKRNYCGLGSVKTNIGHLDVAAGVAGLIKTALALYNKQIPPTINYKNANPNIDFENSPFYVVDTLRSWDPVKENRYAGISAFGVGGTNAHVIIQDYNADSERVKSDKMQVLLLSAKTPTALSKRIDNLAEYLQNSQGIYFDDLVYTLESGRTQFKYRKTIVSENIKNTIEALSKIELEESGSNKAFLGNQKKVFMFSGQGSQYVNMCRDIYETERVFREEIDYCFEFLKSNYNLDLRSIIFPDGKVEDVELINRTRITQPALFAVEYALSKQLFSWGIKPKALIGHSIGEYVAACLSGVLSLDNALTAVYLRGKLMQSMAVGAMLSIPLSELEILNILPSNLSVAVINGPYLTVVAGEVEDIKEFKLKLSKEKGVDSTIIKTSHAFHSHMMEPAIDEFIKIMDGFQLKAPKIPFVSNVTARWITDEEAVSPDYWGQHLRRTVRFSESLQLLYNEGIRDFIEVGPNQVLCSLAKQNIDIYNSLILPTTSRPLNDESSKEILLKSIGTLWEEGYKVNWSLINGTGGVKIPLPAYPFERKKYWINDLMIKTDAFEVMPDFEEKNLNEIDKSALSTDVDKISRPGNDLELQIVNVVSNILGVKEVDIYTSFFDMGGDSITAAQLFSSLRKVIDSKFDLSDIFKYPTVESLAKFISEGGVRLKSNVLELNKSNDNRAVYFIVGLQIYHALASNIKDIAKCYGVFLPAEESLLVSGVDLNKWKVSDLAASYCDEIIKHSKGKSLSIVGLSFGGVVGYELARQLTERGVEVSLLIMLDSMLPSCRQRSYGRWIITQCQKVLKQGPSPLLNKLYHKKENSIKKGRGLVEVHSENPDALATKRLVVYEDAIERFERSEQSTVYSGNVLLIKARDANNFPGYDIDPFYGWTKHLNGNFKTEIAPGDHLSILKTPNVEYTAEIIRKALLELTP